MQTFGAGNAPDNQPIFLQALKDAIDKGVVVVNVTQCLRGSVEAHYAAGTALVEAGVVPAGDMTPEAALGKLAWLLGDQKLSSYEVRELFMRDLRGELTVTEANDFSMKNDRFAKAVFQVMARQGLSAISNLDSNQNEISEIKNAILPTLICQFAGNGNLDELAQIFDEENDPITPDLTDYDGRAGLHVASAQGNTDICDFLIHRGANVNIRDNFGRTPLREAVENGQRATAEVLARNGGTFGLDDADCAALLCSLTYQNNIDKLRLYCEFGAKVNASDYDLRTPLHIASSCGYVDSATVLLKYGASKDAVDRFGNSAKNDADREGHRALAALLGGERI